MAKKVAMKRIQRNTVKQLFSEWLTLIGPLFHAFFSDLEIENWLQDTWLLHLHTWPETIHYVSPVAALFKFMSAVCFHFSCTSSGSLAHLDHIWITMQTWSSKDGPWMRCICVFFHAFPLTVHKEGQHETSVKPKHLDWTFFIHLYTCPYFWGSYFSGCQSDSWHFRFSKLCGCISQSSGQWCKVFLPSN